LKRTEEALNECEERFRAMVDTAPVMIWRFGTDKLCTFCNREWLSFRGRTMEQELAAAGLRECIAMIWNNSSLAYDSSFDARRSFSIEYRVRRWDGEYRWILGQGVPQHSSGSTFVGYLGLCSDITELRMAKQAALAQQNLEIIGQCAEASLTISIIF
jgi:PAS domain S-box-containing protein